MAYPDSIYFLVEMEGWSLPSVQVEPPVQLSFTRPRVNTKTTMPTKTAMDLRNLEIMLEKS
jgi:hypothetical protein